MGAFLLWLALGLVTQLWLCFRVARSSMPLAIATFLLGPVGALYTLFKHHGEEDASVTTPFVANLVCCVLLVVAGWQQLTAWAAGAAAQPGLMAGSEVSEKEAGFTPTSFAAATPGGAAAPASAPEEVPPADPIDVLAAELRRLGVQSTVLRLPPSTRLPEGVVSGAQLAMASMPGAGEWMHVPGAAASAGGASAGSAGRTELSGLFLRCDAAATCRGVARAYMAQDPATRPRVLQNGTLLLLISNINTADTGNMHNVVASAFRHLPPR